jgi:probable rRNA maturation factor
MSIVEIKKTVRAGVPRIDYQTALKLAIPKEYTISLVLVGDSLMRRLNREYRKKDYSTNVLAFPIDKNEGEIFINVRKAEKEAQILSINAKERVLYLFIHACLHLRGLSHGIKMEKREKEILNMTLKK